MEFLDYLVNLSPFLMYLVMPASMHEFLEETVILEDYSFVFYVICEKNRIGI